MKPKGARDIIIVYFGMFLKHHFWHRHDNIARNKSLEEMVERQVRCKSYCFICFFSLVSDMVISLLIFVLSSSDSPFFATEQD